MKKLLESFKLYKDIRFIFIFFLGFISGLPFNILASSVVFWLKYAAIANSMIGLFSMVRMPYSFKFIWAPLLEKFSIPGLSKRIGNRKAWALSFQLLLFLFIAFLSRLTPQENLGLIFVLGIGIAVASCSLDIMVDTIKIKMLNDDEQGAGAGVANIGYRLGMVVSGAVALFVADYISWSSIFTILAVIIALGIIVILLVKEKNEAIDGPSSQSFMEPFLDFMKKDSWLFILVFLIVYKLCNAVLGNMSGPFYVEMGFSGREIALTSKILGTLITLAGGFIGGVIVYRYGTLKPLMVAGFFEIFTSFAFAIFSLIGHNMHMFIAVIIFDNIIGGIGNIIFVAFLISLCSKKYTASQFALVTSFSTVGYNTLGAFSGFLADSVGWLWFFIIDGFLMIPALIMLRMLTKRTLNNNSIIQQPTA